MNIYVIGRRNKELGENNEILIYKEKESRILREAKALSGMKEYK